MLTLISGHFHPGLETAFLRRLASLKADRPFDPVTVVLPTGRLRERLERRVAEEMGAVMAVEFHTLSSLPERVVNAAAPLPKPLLTDSLFYDTLVKRILREDRPFQGGYSVDGNELAVPDGFPAAVRATLRDLLDAGVDDAHVEEAIREEFVGRIVDLGTLRELLRLYRLYLARVEKLDVLPRVAVLKTAIQRAPDSSYLRRFAEILFYGFYDMTGLQTDLLHAIAKNHPTRFFFPYQADAPAFAFAKRFRDTFLQPVVETEERVEARRADAPALSPAPRFLSVSGRRDEAMAVSALLHRLREQGIPFSGMAVVARTRERLRGALPAALMESDIPFRTTAAESLAQRPAVAAVLAYLGRAEGERRDVLPEETEVFPEFRKDALPEPAWPERDTWAAFAERTAALIERCFVPASPESGALYADLIASARTLAAFDALGAARRPEFLDALRQRWMDLETTPPAAPAGVSLLHAEAARGLRFRAVVLIGLEEKVFPRVVREDPFLRDDARLALNQTLGHKIGQKMTALEEERLLFELLTACAEETLVLSWQRSDDEGNVVGLSPFVRAFAAERNLSLDAVEGVPRSWSAKRALYSPSELPRRDVIAGLAGAGLSAEAARLSGLFGGDAAALTRGLTAAASLRSFGEPTVRDGLVGALPPDRLFHGARVSATALETYGQCPFRFFALRLLGLEKTPEIGLEEELDPKEKGSAVHAFLEKLYRALTENGRVAPPAALPEPLFDETFRAIFDAITPTQLRLPAVLWAAHKIRLTETLRAFVDLDLARCHAEGWRPVTFEREFVRRFPAPFDRFEAYGKMDRIDQSDAGFSIIDYKTGSARAGSAALLAQKGEKLQAPLYSWLFEGSLGGRLADNVRFSYRYTESPDDDKTLDAEAWLKQRGALMNTIEREIDLIARGVFLIAPGPQCAWCEAVSICRKDHGVSVFRSRQGPGEEVTAIRKPEKKKGAS